MPSKLQSRLESPEDGVRQAAVPTLGLVAKEGDEGIISLVTKSIGDGSWAVRQTALSVLVQLSSSTDERSDIISTVIACTEDEDLCVRRAALTALGQMAAKGNWDVLCVIRAHLGHEVWWIRQAAVIALSHLAQKSDEDAIASLAMAASSHEDRVIAKDARVALDMLEANGR